MIRHRLHPTRDMRQTSEALAKVFFRHLEKKTLAVVEALGFGSIEEAKSAGMAIVIEANISRPLEQEARIHFRDRVICRVVAEMASGPSGLELKITEYDPTSEAVAEGRKS